MSKNFVGLSRRGNIWQYRKRVPDDLRPLIGKTEIVRSLETADHKEAKRLYFQIASKVQDELSAAANKLLCTAQQSIPVMLANKLAFG